MERSTQRRSGPRQRVVVIGGGISGLSAAYRLDRLAWEQGRRIDIRLLESSHRLGGQVRSERVDGCLLEAGPDSIFAFKPAGPALCRELGLEEELIHPRADAGGMQVAHRGRLARLPRGFFIMAPTELRPLLGSSLFSWRGKLRMACEPLIPARTTDADESLREFVTRRFGREAFERAAEPILGGLFTADADRLSMQLAVPRFREMERRHGSVLRGVREARRKRGNGTGPQSAFISLRSGLGRLIEALAERLPEATIATGARVAALDLDRGAGVWRVGGDGFDSLEADGLILACPARAASALLRPLAGDLADDLDGIGYASCATVNLVYDRDRIRSPLDTFGFFVPRSEGSPFLAGSHVSIKFAGRVPEGRVLLRAFLGGAMHPGLLEQDDRALIELARTELERYLRIEGAPRMERIHRCPQSMPQFGVGDAARLRRIARRAESLPGLSICGGADGAIGLPDCIVSGERAARVTAGRLFAEGSRQVDDLVVSAF